MDNTPICMLCGGSPVIEYYVNGHLCVAPDFRSVCQQCRPLYDYNRFWEAISAYAQFQRLAEVLRLATDEKFCEKVFGAHSASARLKLIATAIRFPTAPLWEMDAEGMQ